MQCRGLAPIAIGALGLWLACGGGLGASGPVLLGLEGSDRETLAAAYPLGTSREVIRGREAQALVFSIRTCDFGTRGEDAALDAAIRAFQGEHPGVAPSCDRVRLARTGWATVVGGLAYYQDYVFFDSDDQVLVAYRTFIQRSGR